MLFDPPEAAPPAPLLPPTSLSRPPEAQTRAVLVVMVGFVLVLCVLAYFGLRSFGSGGGTPTNPTPAGGSPSKTSSPTASASGTAAGPTAGAAIRITKASGFDPQGDGSEKDNLAKLAFDSKPSSGWTSDTYKSPNWGGLKKGVGLRLDLGGDQTVHSAQLRIGGTGASIQLLAVNGDSLAGSTVLAKRSAADGSISLTFAKPATTRYVVIWFTTPGQFNDGYRAEVDDVELR
jgi:hypothetical protein